VARRVMRFAERAEEAQWRSLERAMAGADMPVLSGLRHILDCDLDRHESADDEQQSDNSLLGYLNCAEALREADRCV
jgi:hypothetical protein